MYDLALRLTGDADIAARLTIEVTLRSLGRAEDGEADAMSQGPLLRAVMNHAAQLRAALDMTPTDAAMTVEPAALVALDLAVRHGLDDRMVAGIVGSPRAGLDELRERAIAQLAASADVTTTVALRSYRGIAQATAPQRVHDAVRTASFRFSGPLPGSAVRSSVAWTVGVLIMAATALLLFRAVVSFGQGGTADVAVAVATPVQVETHELTTLTQTSGDPAPVTFGELTAAPGEDEAAPTVAKDGQRADAAPVEPSDEPTDPAPSESPGDARDTTPTPGERAIEPLNDLLPGA